MSKITINLKDKTRKNILNRSDIQNIFYEYELNDIYFLNFKDVKLSYSGLHELLIYSEIYNLTFTDINNEFMIKFNKYSQLWGFG